ncbi:hypothetical protein HY639_04165 [Candidatus Woesearchaeota archaeon]|nr:hypothetical protein [Candidatus Woesearchaeota archaeon]
MRLAFYFTHCETLGHTTRVFALAEGLHALSHIDFLFLQGGKPLSALSPFPVINLPYPFYSKQVFRGAMQQPTTVQVKERIQTMYDALTRFAPDIFMTEYFPFGREDCAPELLPILHWLKRKGVKLYASIGYPVVSTPIHKVEQWIPLFDRLFVHTPKEYDLHFLQVFLEKEGLSSTAAWYNTFFKKYDILLFTGYVLPSTLKKTNREPMILLSRGGGVIYPKLIAYGLQLASQFPDYRFVCVPGPASSPAELHLFTKLANCYHVQLHPHVASLSGLFASARACINMAGYGTVVQLLYCGTPSVLVPREKENNNFYLEQRYRAFMAEQLGFSVTHSYEQLTTPSLAVALRKALQLHPKQLPENCFDGIKNTAQAIRW